MPDFGITEAQIVGLFMESVFYGPSHISLRCSPETNPPPSLQVYT